MISIPLANATVEGATGPIRTVKDLGNALGDTWFVIISFDTEENKFLLRQLRTVLFATMDLRISDKKSWYWTIAGMLGKVLEEASASGKIRPVNYIKVSALFIDSINSLMAHRILSEVEETIEQDVDELMDLYLNGLKLRKMSG
jgi:hypothetical protein